MNTVIGTRDSYGKPLLVIIPAYNEEKNIGAVLEAMQTPEIAAIADVLVMNDASTDSTAEIVWNGGAHCVTHVFNLGYGGGLQVGYKYAARLGYRFVIQMDADGQHDVSNIPALYAALTADSRPDIVLGSRYMEGSSPYDPGPLKNAAYRWFRWIIKRMTGQTIADPTSGLQGLSRRAIRFYSGYQHFDDRYPDANMLVQMLLLGFRVEQIPAVMHYRTQGASMHSGIVKPAVYMLRMTLSLIAVWLRVRVLKIQVSEAEALLREDRTGREEASYASFAQ